MFCDDSADGAVVVHRNFGLKTCIIHEQQANIVCKSYMHKEEIARVQDVQNSQFYMLMKTKRFKVADHAMWWSLETDFSEHLLSVQDGKWVLPSVVHSETHNGNLYTGIYIDDFLKPETYETFADYVLVCEHAKFLAFSLQNGIYKQEDEIYKMESHFYNDLSRRNVAGIVRMVSDGGREGRVFIPELSKT
jgi:hypothetical protein